MLSDGWEQIAYSKVLRGVFSHLDEVSFWFLAFELNPLTDEDKLLSSLPLLCKKEYW